MEINTSGLYSTIYAGGGKFLTQAGDVDAHVFVPKVYCLTADTAKWREVTANEKAAIEKSEAESLEPTPTLVTMWKAAVRTSGWNVYMKGGYDEATRTGTLNGIKGLTASEMADILHAGTPENPTDTTGAFAFNPFIRTNLWSQLYWDGTIAGQKVFYKCANLEVACASYLRVGTDTFSGCPKLHTIIGPLYGNGKDPAPFKQCASLVNVPGYGWWGVLNIAESPLLSLTSINALINSANASATGLTLHPDAYARVTEEIFAAAAEKNITIATT